MYLGNMVEGVTAVQPDNGYYSTAPPSNEIETVG